MTYRGLSSSAVGLGATLALATAAYAPTVAHACGCVAPPAVTEGEFAVNQQAEQIIFEVGADSVTAHVLIKYAGAPEEFAWIIPVPGVPDLALSETFAFALLDSATAPAAFVSQQNLCPSHEYVCTYHPACPGDGGDPKFDLGGDSTGGDTGGATGGGEPPPGVDVLDMQIIGSYQTVTFAASEADLAVQWLQDNGFVVNDTMTPFMQSYIDSGMVFVAAKLVAGAEVSEIRPLQLTYPGIQPMIPLKLTAVAAEPHLTVTSYIFGEDWYQPKGTPLVEIDEKDISEPESGGRVNYPMVLARTIDDAGGEAFVAEYAGPPVLPQPDDPSGCCERGSDWCGVGGDGQCQCFNSDFDADDCALIDGLLEGVALLDALGQQHSRVTRLTTRISPEEMTFDPLFEVAPMKPVDGQLVLQGQRSVLSGCTNDIIDTAEANLAMARQACASVYCGEGTCMVTAAGAGCACNAGFVARSFTDLDGEASVTCVPDTPLVDMGKDIALPDACAGIDCGIGQCVDVNGFAACQCDGGAAAVAPNNGDPVPICSSIETLTASPGAEDFSAALADVDVCAPAPPNCGSDGWLIPNPNKVIQGVLCETSIPDPSDLEVPPMPECPDTGGTTGDTGTTSTTGATASGTGFDTDDSGGGDGGDATVTRAACACTTDGGQGGLAVLGLGLLGLLRRRPRS